MGDHIARIRLTRFQLRGRRAVPLQEQSLWLNFGASVIGINYHILGMGETIGT